MTKPHTACVLISTGQAPAECTMFAQFAFAYVWKSAQQQGIDFTLMEQTQGQLGLLSATVLLSGDKVKDFVDSIQGTWQWICVSPIRPKHLRKNWFIAVSELPLPPRLPEENEVQFQTCRARGKGGQHVNTTNSAVRATHTATGICVRVESERSQHINKQRALVLLAAKLAQAQHTVNQQYQGQKHRQLYQIERGNPKRVFVGRDFVEQ